MRHSKSIPATRRCSLRWTGHDHGNMNEKRRRARFFGKSPAWKKRRRTTLPGHRSATCSAPVRLYRLCSMHLLLFHWDPFLLYETPGVLDQTTKNRSRKCYKKQTYLPYYSILCDVSYLKINNLIIYIKIFVKKEEAIKLELNVSLIVPLIHYRLRLIMTLI